MPSLLLRTEVATPMRETFARFDSELLAQLTPPLVKVELERFDGSNIGDIVILRMKILFFLCQRWECSITEREESQQECFFTDESEGAKLPFFLKKWRHCHRVQAHPSDPTRCIIIDDIQYRAPFGLNALLYPVLWAQFAFRRPIYRRFFGK